VVRRHQLHVRRLDDARMQASRTVRTRSPVRRQWHPPPQVASLSTRSVSLSVAVAVRAASHARSFIHRRLRPHRMTRPPRASLRRALSASHHARHRVSPTSTTSSKMVRTTHPVRRRRHQCSARRTHHHRVRTCRRGAPAPHQRVYRVRCRPTRRPSSLVDRCPSRVRRVIRTRHCLIPVPVVRPRSHSVKRTPVRVYPPVAVDVRVRRARRRVTAAVRRRARLTWARRRHSRDDQINYSADCRIKRNRMNGQYRRPYSHRTQQQQRRSRYGQQPMGCAWPHALASVRAATRTAWADHDHAISPPVCMCVSAGVRDELAAQSTSRLMLITVTRVRALTMQACRSCVRACRAVSVMQLQT
jgi:hypothetical protein